MGDASFITWLSAVPLALILGSIVAVALAWRSPPSDRVDHRT
jgi:hypothetical protein